jgi:hypothetical protein
MVVLVLRHLLVVHQSLLLVAEVVLLEAMLA